MINALSTATNGSSSDPINESVFDLMATVLIASVIIVDVDHIKRHEIFLQKMFLCIGIFLACLIIPSMEIWFCYRAYNDTKDTFFLAYLITTVFLRTLIYGIEGFRMRSISVKYCYLLPISLCYICRFIKDIIFGFVAVNRGYINSPTHWFIVGPVILAFFIGAELFINAITSSDKKLNEWEQASDEIAIAEKSDDIAIAKERNEKHKKLVNASYRKTQRPKWIIGFCSNLIFSLIVAPSVLWIKFYLMLGFIVYTMADVSKKLERKFEAKNRTGT